jgi:hypothetical protein
MHTHNTSGIIIYLPFCYLTICHNHIPVTVITTYKHNAQKPIWRQRPLFSSSLLALFSFVFLQIAYTWVTKETDQTPVHDTFPLMPSFGTQGTDEIFYSDPFKSCQAQEWE